MSTKIQLIPHSKLIRYLELRRDVATEIIRRLDVADEIQGELDDAETKIGDLEMSIQDTIDNLRGLL